MRQTEELKVLSEISERLGKVITTLSGKEGKDVLSQTSKPTEEGHPE
jgi:hypothetical protein